MRARVAWYEGELGKGRGRRKRRRLVGSWLDNEGIGRGGLEKKVEA